MSLVLKISGVDRSDWVDWRTLVKTEGLTKSPDSLVFDIKETPSKTIPAMGVTVQLLEDAVKIFEGTIVNRKSIIIGGVLKGYSLQCKDKVYEFDKTLVSKAYNNQAVDDIVADIVSTFTSGFTTVNVEAGLPTIDSVRFNYEQPSKCLQKLADLIGYDWYIDYDGDIHFFTASNNPAPFEVEDDNGKIISNSLNFDQNILELKNSMIVRGGEYKSAFSAAETPDIYEATGVDRVFKQIYRYSDVEVTVNGAAKTVGTDNIHDPLDYDVLYNFTEKAIKFRDDNKPTAGQEVKIFGDAHIPLIGRVRDQVSIATYGEYQGIIVDKTIESVDEAHTRAKAELVKWAEGASSGSFRTLQTGLQTGQYIRINSSQFGIDLYFKINSISARAISATQLEYNVKFLASGELTFTDMMIGLLSKDRQNIIVSDDEVVQRLELIPENITIVDSAPTVTKNSPPYTWGAASSNPLVWGFGTWSD